MSTTESIASGRRKLRRRVTRKLPPEKLLPDTQPAYVASWIYVFGVATLSALVVVIAHRMPAGHPRTPVVARPRHRPLRQLAAPVERGDLLLRHGHPSLGQVLHGRLARRTLPDVDDGGGHCSSRRSPRRSPATSRQTNFDSQWISTQAKDGINATGGGAYFNVLNLGQMLMWHIVLLPDRGRAADGLHVVMVRLKGVVPPFEDAPRRRR